MDSYKVKGKTWGNHLLEAVMVPFFRWGFSHVATLSQETEPLSQSDDPLSYQTDGVKRWASTKNSQFQGRTAKISYLGIG